MKIHNHATVILYHVVFDAAETKALLEHKEFSRWIGIDHREGGRQIANASLSRKQMQRIAIYLDVDYRLVNDRADALLAGDAPKALPIIAGVAKEGAESKVDRLRIARVA